MASNSRFGAAPKFSGDPLDAALGLGGDPRADEPKRKPRQAAGPGARQAGVTKGKIKFSADVTWETIEEVRNTSAALGIPISSIVQTSLDKTLEQIRKKYFGGNPAPQRNTESRGLDI